jgi:hypothetical protein
LGSDFLVTFFGGAFLGDASLTRSAEPVIWVTLVLAPAAPWA